MFNLTGKGALVTGATGGIGEAIARALHGQGATLVVSGTKADKLEALVNELGTRAHALPCNLSDRAAVGKLAAEAESKLGQLDILVNNAAYQNRKAIDELDEEDWDRTFKTNIYAYYRLVKAALPHLQPGTSIIATGSITGIQGAGPLPDYSATKGAIHAFTKALAQQLLERGIRVNCIAPGPVWTPLNAADAGMTPDKVARFGEKTPMKRPAQPEEIAPAYVFFASNADSSFMTGVVLPALGGETI